MHADPTSPPVTAPTPPSQTAASKIPAHNLRHTVEPADADQVRQLATSTGFFHPGEVDVAVELVTERLTRGVGSGYEFLFEDRDAATGHRCAGYICFGEIGCTVGSYDIYWIIVHPDDQGQGVGRRLLAAAEQDIAARAGRQIYIETSGRPLYRPTHGFYLRCGYTLCAEFPDFYAPGDAKLVFRKLL